MKPKVGPLMVMAGLVTCTLAAWYNCFNGVFVLDDQSGIVANPAIRQIWPLGGIFGWPPPVKRPLTELSLAVNYFLGGLSTWGYHAVNLALHLVGGLLLFGLVRRTLLLASPRKGFSPEAIAGASALLWLVHPLQTESVTYVIQRAEVLAGMFHLLVLYSALRAYALGNRNWWRGLAVLSCLLGVGAKESMFVAPLAVLLFDRGFLYPSFRLAFRERWPLYSGLVFSWVVLGALLVAGPRYEGALGNATHTVLEYARTQPAVILHYLRLCVWPSPLILDYEWRVAGWTIPELLPGFLVVGGLLVFLLAKYRVYPRACSVGLWGYLVLAPSSSVFPLSDLAFEHRMYLPLAAVVILAVTGVSWSAGKLMVKPAGERLGLVLLAIVAVLLMAATARRNSVYGNAIGMYEDLVSRRPNSVRGHHNLSTSLAAEGRYGDALPHIRRTVEIFPVYKEGYFNLGYILYRLGRKEEAMRAYRKALAISPTYQAPAVNLAIMLRARGRFAEADAIILRLKGDSPGLIKE